jgi:uncharacterized protein YrzB (UPF0473 family)
VQDDIKDFIMIEDEEGNQKEFAVEALFDMNDKSYAFLSADNETFLMIEGEEGDQYLTGIHDSKESKAILDAYQIALQQNSANDE